jgi:hypothetical protein
MKRILNCIPSRHSENDWKFDNAINANILKAPAQLPKSVDLRSAWWEVGDQGGTGACVGWAVADSLLRWHFARVDRIDKVTHLAARYVWMAAKETDEFLDRPTSFIESDGTSLKAALDVVRKFGIVADQVLPFVNQSMYTDDVMTFYAIASQLKIASYINLERNLSRWRTWLAQEGPVLVRLDVDATWDSADDTLGRLETYQPDTARGGHAVVLVGYTTDGFIVRNSWGKDWGDQGYAYASIPYAQAAFTEAYGVSL